MQAQRALGSASCSTSTSYSAASRRPPAAPVFPRHHACGSLPARRGCSTIAAASRQSQSGNVATKRKLRSGPPGLPPINDNGGGGGGGGDGWHWERTARNLAPNLIFLGVYFAVTTWGGDGWGGGFFGHGGGGGGGGGGDGWGDGGQGHHGNPSQSNSSTASNKDEQEEDEPANAYSYASSCRSRSSYRA